MAKAIRVPQQPLPPPPPEDIQLTMTVEQAAHVMAFIGQACSGPTAEVFYALSNLIPYGSKSRIDFRSTYEQTDVRSYKLRVVK